MIKHSINSETRIVRLKPGGPLEKADFEKLSQEVDPLIQEYQQLKGVLLVVPAFPGWEDFDGMLAHMEFVKKHHEHVDKLALVTKDAFMKQAAVRIAEYHFLHPEIKVFETEEDAQAWLEG